MRSYFYGWNIVAAIVLMGLVGGSVVFISAGVLAYPLADEFGWSRGEIAAVVSIVQLVFGASGPWIGRLCDGRGPRLSMIVGAGLTGAGLIAAAGVHQLWHLYAVYVLLAVGTNLTGNIPFSVLIARWFRRRRGVAFGALSAGFSLSFAIAVPSFTFLVQAFGWRSATAGLGLLSLAVALPLSLFVIHDRPGDLGLEPDGKPPGRPVGAPPADRRPPISVGTALRMPEFWLILVAVGTGFAVPITLSVHLVPFLRDAGTDAQQAAFLYSATGLLGGGARLVAGWFVDRVGNPGLMLGGALVMLAGSVAALAIGGTQPLALVLFVVLYGIGSSAAPSMQPLLMLEAFGPRGLGTLLGAIGVFMTAILVGAPLLTGLAYDARQSYTLPFFLLAAATACGALASVQTGAIARQRRLHPAALALDREGRA